MRLYPHAHPGWRHSALDFDAAEEGAAADDWERELEAELATGSEDSPFEMLSAGSKGSAGDLQHQGQQQQDDGDADDLEQSVRDSLAIK